MFNSNLILGKDFAQKFIPHLHFSGPVDEAGYSLSIVGRATLHNRVTEEMPLTITAKDLVEPEFADLAEIPENNLVIYRTQKYLEDEVITRILRKWDDTICPEYQINQAMDMFLSKLRSDSTVPVFRYYVDEAHHKAIAVVLSSDYNVAWIVQATLHQLLPWLFTTGRTAEEQEFLKSIFKNGGDDANTAYIKKIEELYGMERAWLLEQMRTWSHDMATRRYRSIRQEIERLETKLAEAQKSYASLYRNLLSEKERENEARVASLKQTESGNELVEMFDKTESLVFDRIDGHRLVFRVYTDLASWDEEAYRNNVATDESYIWIDDCGDDRCDEEYKDEWHSLFDDIFVNDRYRIRVQAEFTLDLDDCNVEGRRCSGSGNMDGYIDNPHIGGYGCMGQNTPLVAEALAKGNMVYAIDQCIHSAANFNFDDSTVGDSMFYKLFSYPGKCIYDVMNDEVITIREALKRSNA